LLGQRLEPRRDIDTVAENVPVVDNHVADVDADAKADALALFEVGVTVFYTVLHHHGGAHRINDRCKLDEGHRPWS
jgi:hypothetical protein